MKINSRDLTRIGWCVSLIVLFWVSLLDSPDEFSLINDKLAHFGSYIVLGIWGLFGWRDAPWKMRLMWFLGFYGFAIECAQYFVPMRYFSIADWIMNLAGIIVAVTIFNLLLGRANS